MPTIWPYGRASTDKQTITIDAQMERVAAAARLKIAMGTWAGYEVKDFLADKSVSASIPLLERPMGNYIATHAQPGDIIVVSNYDRAFRSLSDLCQTLDWLAEKDVKIVVLDMDFDTSTSTGRMFVSMLAVIKQYEREEIVRRTREAIEYVVKQRGVWVAPIGWKLERRPGKRIKQVVPDHKTRRIGEWIVNQVDKEGWTIAQCWRDLNFKKANVKALKRGPGHMKCHDLYVACKAGWPMKASTYGRRRPCAETTAS